MEKKRLKSRWSALYSGCAAVAGWLLLLFGRIVMAAPSCAASGILAPSCAASVVGIAPLSAPDQPPFRLYDSAGLQAIPLYTERRIRKEKPPVEAVIRLQVKKVPESWGSFLEQFPRLQELHLSRLRLKSVPPEVFALPYLSVLDISNNAINYLPPELGNLTRLRELHLNRTNIAYLPRSVARLEKLEVIDAWSTNISELPSEISRLRGVLKRIDLRVIQMTEEQLQAMQRLLPSAEILVSPSCGCGH